MKKKKDKEAEHHDVDPLEEMKLRLEEAAATADENMNLAKYYKAEFENFKKRNADALSNARNDGRASVVMQILPLMDALYEGLKSMDDKGKEGIEILIRKFRGVLETLGVEEFDSVGEPFDPHLHNAVATGSDDSKPPDTVLEEWQKGYKMNGKIIRPATVKVNQ